MAMTDPALLTGLSVALGCGLLIGIERERRKGSGPARAFAGMRSFALAALCGALAQVLGPVLVGAGALLVAALVTLSYWRDRSDDPGITTELALFLTYLLGVNALERPALSGAVAVVAAAMLALRGRLHHFARVSLSAGELHDGLLLAGAVLVAWLLLPDAPVGWMLGVNPRRLWGLAILVMCVQSGAHVALRVAGARLGLALSGLAAGFVSSVATTAAMGARCRREPALLAACVTAALMSNIATFVLLLAIAAAVAPALLGQLAPVFGAGLAAAAVAAWIAWRGQGGAVAGPAKGGPFSLRDALVFAALLYGASAALAWANARLGAGALQLGAALAGMFDVHAASGSVLSLGGSGALAPRDALRAAMFAVSSNTLSKLGAALAGGLAYAWRLALAHAAILAAAWCAFWLLPYLD